MRVTILGCGTSGGVPRVGPHWGRCNPREARNRRRRASILVQDGDSAVLVDTSPDLREQCLDAGIGHIDAVVYTHDHADHTHGIDDLRAFFFELGHPVPIHADPRTLAILRKRFDYIFAGSEGYPAVCEGHEIDGPIDIRGLQVLPFEQYHGPINSLGLRFGPLAYSTDVKALSEEAFAALEGVRVWIVAALRPQPHPTHAHLDLVLDWIERVRPERAVLTHMTNELDYEWLKQALPDGIEPAYDGMVIEI